MKFHGYGSLAAERGIGSVHFSGFVRRTRTRLDHLDLSFRRFEGLGAQNAAPDETTIVKFHDRLCREGVDAKLFEIVARSIEEWGCLCGKGPWWTR